MLFEQSIENHAYLVNALISGQKRMYLKRMRNARVEIAILAAQDSLFIGAYYHI